MGEGRKTALRVDCECEIVLTGSNARLLSGELTTLLAGRYVEIQMFPLSFDEFLEFRKDSGEDIHKSFDAFLMFGGLPGLHELQASPRATCSISQRCFQFRSAERRRLSK